MLKIKLTTRDGRFVAFVEVVPMNPPPDIVVWGARSFKHHGMSVVDGTAVDTYQEVLTVVSFTESPGLPH